MRYRPTFEEFVELAREASLVPVYRQLIGDTLTPVSAFCKIQEGEWAFLFESVVGGERLGRYSFVGSGPFLRFQAFGHRVVLQPATGPAVEMEHPDPLRLLEEKLAAYRAPSVARPAALLRRRRRLRRLRHRALRRTAAQPAARRPPPARPLLRLLRPHGDLRPHQQDHRRRRPTPTSIRCRPPPVLPGRLRSRGSAGRAVAAGRRRFAADRHGAGRRGNAAVPIQLRAGRVRGGRGQVQGVHQGRRHLPGRAQPALADGDEGPTFRHLPDACASSIRVRSCFISRRVRFVWWAARRRSWCASRATR